LTELREAIRQSAADAARVLLEVEEARDCLRDVLPPAVPASDTLEILDE
jgi:hypothetical protein